MSDFAKTCVSSFFFRFKSERGVARYRQKKLNELVKYAYDNSPYYHELYKNVDFSRDITLSELPVTNKAGIMADYENALTDRTVRRADVFEFIKDIGNCKKLLYDKYMVIMTSGSTGGAVSVLYDRDMVNHVVASGSIHSFATLKELRSYCGRGRFVVTVCQNVSFGVANQVNQHNIAGLRHQERVMAWVHSLSPIEEIVARLNVLQPALLNTYSSTLELLCDEQEAGRLHIRPAVVGLGGESLSDRTRRRAEELFDAEVHSNYSCSEGGEIASECSRDRLHINEDAVIIEAVDADGKPVPYGEKSAKIYLTNLINKVQPVIRYEVTDCVTIHDEGCPCGRKSKWLQVEGRTGDVLKFNNGTRSIPTFGVYMRVYDLLCLKHFQVIVHGGNRVELRVVPVEGCSVEEAYKACADAVLTYLASNGVPDAECCLSQYEPERDEKNMKFRGVYQADD